MKKVLFIAVLVISVSFITKEVAALANPNVAYTSGKGYKFNPNAVYNKHIKNDQTADLAAF